MCPDLEQLDDVLLQRLERSVVRELILALLQLLQEANLLQRAQGTIGANRNNDGVVQKREGSVDDRRC